MKAALEKRGLKAEIDTSTMIFTSLLTRVITVTPNGYNLQISHVTHDKRLTLANAVKPKPFGGL